MTEYFAEQLRTDGRAAGLCDQRLARLAPLPTACAHWRLVPDRRPDPSPLNKEQW